MRNLIFIFIKYFINNIVKLKGGMVIPLSSQNLLSAESKSLNQGRTRLTPLTKSTDSIDRRNSLFDNNVEKKKKDRPAPTSHDNGRGSCYRWLQAVYR